MKHQDSLTAFAVLIGMCTVFSSSGCLLDKTAADGDPCLDDEIGDSGETGDDEDWCADQAALIDPLITIPAIAALCTDPTGTNGRVDCDVMIHLPEGHDGNFGVGVTGIGAVSWNTEPYNVDAGALEDAELIGIGIQCGHVSLNTATIPVGSLGTRYYSMQLSDDTQGLFTTTMPFQLP